MPFPGMRTGYKAPKPTNPLQGIIDWAVEFTGPTPGVPYGRSAAAAEAGGGVRPEGSMATLGGKPVQWMDNRWVPFMTEGEMARQEQARIRAQAPAAPALPPPSGGTTLIYGTRDGVTPDRTQSDEYKAKMAQYGALQKQKKYGEAEKLGMEIWQQKYGKTPLGQPGGAVGTKNPLMEGMPSFVSTPSNVVAGQNMPTPGYSTESNLSIAANAVPAPWYTQGAKVSSDFAGVVPAQASKTTGEGMPPLQTTGQTAGQKVTDFLIKLNELKGLF